ncbi:TRAP transporter small permease subunit [Paracoccus jeotgali]|uniref:TRAP transporter small permease subunit n=1 Tax=Paracoccus jeotgali TaxID=2065379 RepID=UPI0028AC15CD|nr:TRAP transporter small permease [Paracoccus jeotgali]
MPQINDHEGRQTDAPPADAQNLLEKILCLATAASRALAIFGGLLIVAAAALICVEIVVRRFAGISTGVTDELSSYAFAIGATLALAHCLVERAHIRVDSATRFLPAAVRIWIDLLATAALTGFFAMIARYATETAWISFTRGSRAMTQLQTPLYIPQGLWAAALIFFVLVGVIMLAAAATRLLRGKLKAAEQLVATRTGLELEAEL